MLIVVVLGLLTALPLSGLIGSTTYRGQLAVSVEQQATRHLATATLVENAPSPVPATDGAYLGANGGTTGVQARWTLPGGAEQVGMVNADPGATAGTRVPVWLSDTGNVVPAPMTASDAVTTSILAAMFSWIVAALGLAALYWVVRLILDRRRAVHWDREWLHAGDRWARS